MCSLNNLGIRTCAQPQCWTLFSARLDAQDQESDAGSGRSARVIEIMESRLPNDTDKPITCQISKIQGPVVSIKKKLVQASTSRITMRRDSTGKKRFFSSKKRKSDRAEMAASLSSGAVLVRARG